MSRHGQGTVCQKPCNIQQRSDALVFIQIENAEEEVEKAEPRSGGRSQRSDCTSTSARDDCQDVQNYYPENQE